VVFKAQTQGSVEVDAQKGEDSVDDREDTSKIKQPKVPEPSFCHQCKTIGHIARECRWGWQQNRVEHGNPGVGNRKAPCDLIGPLCATQTKGHAFFMIPICSSEVNACEGINIVVVTILKVHVTTKLIEDEFARILPGVWRWTARKVANNMYTVRFPNAQLIKEWNIFNPISLRIVKAKIMVESWNGSIGAKGELQQVWFRVTGERDSIRSQK
jgi:hypothetical protein